jgi:hypothetical protein
VARLNPRLSVACRMSKTGGVHRPAKWQRAVAELANLRGRLKHRGKGGGSGYGLRHDRLVTGKYEGRFLKRRSSCLHVEGTITRTVLQARREAGPTRGQCHGTHRHHEAAKHLKAATQHTISPFVNRTIGRPEETGWWLVSSLNFQYHLWIRKCCIAAIFCVAG